MADLNACYFCGDPTVEVHPVIPPRMNPPDDAQHTVALCQDCGEKLDAVVEPIVGFIVERANREAGSTASRAESASGDDVRPGESGATSGPGDSGGEPTGTGDGPPDAGGDEPTGTSDEPTGTGGEPTGTDDDQATADGPTADATGDDASDASPDAGGSATAPASYRKVLRLLQNREFPVDRAEFETVAANAYELSPGEVGTAIDVAVDRGLVDEKRGTLRRPE